MKTMLALVLSLSAAGVAAAQDDRGRENDLRREHEKQMQDLDRRFREEREKVEQEFRRRVEELRPREGRPDGERRPEGPRAERRP